MRELVIGLVLLFAVTAAACAAFMFSLAYRNRRHPNGRAAVQLAVGMGIFFTLIAGLAVLGIAVGGEVGRAAFLAIAALTIARAFAVPGAVRLLNRRTRPSSGA